MVKSISERINELEKVLDSIRDDNLLNISKPQVTQYFDMSVAQLRILSAEECGEIAYILSRYNLYIQQVLSKYIARINWCDSNINWIISETVHNYEARSFEERKMIAIRDHDVCFKLIKLKTDSKLIVDKLYGVTQRVDTMINTLIELQRSKRRVR